MKKGKKLYEGKAKIIYATNDKNLAIQYFKDDATAFNNQKKTTIEGKGVLNNRISEHILSNLSQIGIKNHLVKRLNMREQVIKLVEIIPVEFIVRNIATGSITKRLGIEDGTVLKEPLIEYCLKDDKLGDPIIAEEHILAFDWATKKEMEKIKKMILRINDFMIGMFRGVGIKLIDFKLERICSDILLFKIPLPSIVAFFWLLKAVASSLKCWIAVPFSGAAYKILALPSYNFLPFFII